MSRLEDLLKGRATPAPVMGQAPVRTQPTEYVKEADGSKVFKTHCKNCKTTLQSHKIDEYGNTIEASGKMGDGVYCSDCLDKLCPKCEADVAKDGDYLCESCRGY